MKESIIELTMDEVCSVNGGHIRDHLSFGNDGYTISNDSTYTAGVASAIFFAGVLLIPGIGTTVALTAFSASLISSSIAISTGTN